MDKETLSNYGWIVICTLVLAVMIALATPFGEYIKDGVWSTTNGLNDTLNKNMEIAGLSGSDSGDNSEPDTSDFGGFRFGERYICTDAYDEYSALYDYYFYFYEDGSALLGIISYNEEMEFPAGSFSYTDTEIIDTTGELGNFKISENGAKIEMLYEEDGEVISYLVFTHESLVDMGDESIDLDGYATFTDGRTLTWTELKTEFRGVTNKFIRSNTFENCDTLETIVIPEGIVLIGSSAFEDCTSLKNVTIPTTVKYIDNSAFYYCYDIENLYITDLVAWCNIEVGSSQTSPIHFADNLYLNGELITDLVIPNGVTEIKDYSFSSAPITSITLPNSITSIGRDAFSFCQFTDIIIPEGVRYIGKYAFESCSSLKNVTIPTTVTSIDSIAFSYCSSLENVYISDLTAWYNIDFTDTQSNPLYYADNLYLNNNLVTEFVVPNGITEIKNCTFVNASFTNIVIPETVTSIGNAAFHNCKSLISVTIPASVIFIGDSAFSDCVSLKEIIIPNSVTNIERYAFKSCSSLKNIVLPNNITTISTHAFAWSGIENITIPASVTSIEYYAFGYCPSLANITFNGTLAQWNNITKSTQYGKGYATVTCTDGTTNW